LLNEAAGFCAGVGCVIDADYLFGDAAPRRAGLIIAFPHTDALHGYASDIATAP
jgi:hypothetical protein